MTRHPLHITVGALGEKGAQALGDVRNRIRPRYPDRVKAVRAGLGDQRRLQCCRRQRRRFQKSRLA
jgi:hypothetical protein